MTYPFNIDMLSAAEHQLVIDIYNHVSSRSGAETVTTVDFDPNSFSLFTHYHNLNILSVIAIKRAENTYLSFIKLHYTSPGGKSGDIHHYELQLWGSAKLRKDFGHILIRPEKFTDKLIELICPVEIDFEDDNIFSKNFYVIADDKDKAISALNSGFRNAIMQLQKDDFVIEIINNHLIISNRKPASAESAEQLSKFITTVALLR